MTSTCDAIVLGAGIVGAACALELQRSGLNTTVVERDFVIGGGATAAGMGHIVVMDDSEAQFALTSYSQSLWNQLVPELPARIEYQQCGTIWVAADSEQMDAVYGKREFFAAFGISTEVLDRFALAEAEPNLRAGLPGGLLVSSDAVMYPPTAAAYLLEQAERGGAKLRLGSCAVSAARGCVRLSDRSELGSAVIVNATGTAAAALAPGIPVRKRKGHLIITDRHPGFVRHQLVELGYLNSAHSFSGDSVAFNVQPRSTGQVLIGSSRQFDVEDTGIDRSIVSSMIDRAAVYMPGIASLSAIRVWTGFRAATPDKLPLIGPTEDPTIYLATGHEGLGITTSLGTGRLLADHILGRTPAIPIGPYLPERVAMEFSGA